MFIAAKALPDRHNDRHEDADVLDRRGGSGLRFVVGGLGERVHVEALIVVDVVDECLGGDGVGGADQGAGKHFDALQVGADLIQVAPEFAGLRAPAGIHHADDVPIAAAEFDLSADLRFGVAFGDALADHEFAVSLLVPASAGDYDPAAHLDAGGLQSADCDVGAFAGFRAGEVDHADHLERRQRLPVFAGGDAWLELQVLELRAREVADDFRFGAFAHDDHLQRVAGGREGGAQSVDQGENRQQDGDGERDAERGHDGGGLADHKVAQVVGDGDGHGG